MPLSLPCRSGVGITVTSVTDIVVFLVGGSTVLPSLSSYSFFTAAGIAVVYILQVSKAKSYNCVSKLVPL